jgi:6-pyruvoyl-tetrahydropterin synthase related domain
MNATPANPRQAATCRETPGVATPHGWFAQLFDLPLSPDSKKFNRTDALLLGVISLAALASALPFFYAAQGQMPEAGDLIIHWPRMLAFDETLRSGVIMPRWLGGMNGGYGAATTLFYAPLLYYALSAAHALTGDWPSALEMVVALAALGSGLTLYAYARTFSSRAASAVAALLYLLSPYHLIDLYHRGALAELLSFMWMPLVMLAFARVTERFRAPAIAGGALSFALLILAHPPTAYLFTTAFVVFIIFSAMQARRWQPLATGGMIVMLGGALAAFYAMPAILEKSLINQSVTDLFYNRMGFINELLAGDRFEQLIGAIAVTMALSFVVYCWLARRQEPVTDDAVARNCHLAAWKLVGALSFAMLLPLVRPLVSALPGMAAVAFVWRWLAIALLAMVMLAGAATDGLLAEIRRTWPREVGAGSLTGEYRQLARVGVIALVLIGSVGFGIVAAARASNLRIAFIAPATNFEQDFTPAGTPSVYDLPRGKTCEFLMALPGDEAHMLEWQPQRRIIETTSPTGGVLHIYSLMYPGWTASLDRLPVAIEIHPQLKTVLIDMPPGHHQLTMTFGDTRLRVNAGRISLVALGAIGLMLLVGCLGRQIRGVGRHKGPG